MTELGRHIEEPPLCQICEKRFLSHTELTKHIDEKHNPKLVKCDHCGIEIEERHFNDLKKEHNVYQSFKNGIHDTNKKAKQA